MSAGGGAGPGVGASDAEVEAACRAYAIANGEDPDAHGGAVYEIADGSKRPLGSHLALWQCYAPEMRKAIAAAFAARAAAPGLDRGEVERLTRERDEAREIVAKVNNSLGSYSFHTNPHPATLVEDLKKQANREWRRANAAEARAERAADVLIACRPYVKNAARGISWSAAHDLLMRIDAQLGGPARDTCRSAAEPQEQPEGAGGAGAFDPAAAGRSDASLRCPAGYVQDGDACPACGATEDGWCKRDPSDPRNVRALTHKEQP